MWIVVEVEDVNNMFVAQDEDGFSITFDTKEEAEEYANRNMLDGRAVEIEED